jgi:hypothetical protein
MHLQHAMLNDCPNFRWTDSDESSFCLSNEQDLWPNVFLDHYVENLLQDETQVL